MEIWEFRSHLEFVKESRAWDEGQQPCKKRGFKHRSAEGAGDTTGRARFEDSTRAWNLVTVLICLYPPAENRKNIAGPEKHQGSARLYVEYNRPRNRPRALQGGRQCRKHRSNEREECATREPERAWITGDRWRLHGQVR